MTAADAYPIQSSASADPNARQTILCLLLILSVALAIRLWGAWRTNLIFDERAHWALAETIDLRPGHLHFVSRTLDHPPLSIYVLRLTSLLLGTSNFALRLPYVLAGAATVLASYFLGRRLFSTRAGLLAAALLAVDRFHACWSRVFMPEVLMLLFASLAMLQFLRSLERPTVARFAVLGLVLGVAWLAKEPAILLLPAFWLYLLITPEHRPLLRNPRVLFTPAVFTAAIVPDLVWNAGQWNESYLYRDFSLAGHPLRLSLKPLSLYLGELFRYFNADALGEDYLAGNMYVCILAAGILYLLGVGCMLRAQGKPPVRAMIVTFVFICAVFLVLPGGGMYEPFWWASISLVPAIVCAGGLLDAFIKWISAYMDNRKNSSRSPSFWCAAIALFALIVGLGVSTTYALCNEGRFEPRATVQDFAADFLAKGHEALASGDLAGAEGRFIYVLNIAGPQADAYCGLATIAFDRHERGKAAHFIKLCRMLAPKHTGALELQQKMLAP